MSADKDESFAVAVGWLARHAGFPTRRLAKGSELLVCFGIAAAGDEEEERKRFLIQSKDGAQSAALRTHALRRSLVHFKCDNSAKV